MRDSPVDLDMQWDVCVNWSGTAFGSPIAETSLVDGMRVMVSRWSPIRAFGC